jgi:uncharacterized protein DUF3592
MGAMAVTLIIALCMGGIFGGVGIGLLLFGMNQRKQGTASQSWPTTTGTILSATLSQQSRRNSQGYHDVTYAPTVEYTYEVNGNSYRSDKINAGWTVSYDAGTAQNKLSQYQPGTRVTVYYNPTNPANAVLEPKSATGNIFMIAGGIVLVLTVLICCSVAGFSLFTNGLMNSIMHMVK